MKIICFPHAGGTASSYINIKNELVEIAEVILYEYDGHGKKHKMPFYKDMRTAVDKISSDLITNILHNREPYCLLGHSMGAYIAVEVGYILQQLYNYSPEVIFVSGQSSPINLKNEFFDADEEKFQKYIKSLGGIDPIISSNYENMSYLLAPTRNDLMMLSNYKPKIKNIKITSDLYIMYGKDDFEIEKSELELWKKVSGGKVEIEEFEGDHFYILQNYEVIHYIGKKLSERKINKI